MVEAGLLVGEPVELVDGLLLHVTPQGTEHASLVQRLTGAFSARGELLRVQLPLATPEGRPEPDVALAADAGPHALPITAELVVEVAVSSWPEDQFKLPGYAAAGVGAAWLVNVPERAVHVFEGPLPAERRYGSERVLRRGDKLAPPVAGIAPLAVDDLFVGFE